MCVCVYAGEIHHPCLDSTKIIIPGCDIYMSIHPPPHTFFFFPHAPLKYNTLFVIGEYTGNILTSHFESNESVPPLWLPQYYCIAIFLVDVPQISLICVIMFIVNLFSNLSAVNSLMGYSVYCILVMWCWWENIPTLLRVSNQQPTEIHLFNAHQSV